jgi:hypothetical protein
MHGKATRGERHGQGCGSELGLQRRYGLGPLTGAMAMVWDLLRQQRNSCADGPVRLVGLCAGRVWECVYSSARAGLSVRSGPGARLQCGGFYITGPM